MAYGKEGIQSLGSGVVGPLRLNEFGAQVVANSGGKYREAALAGRLFSVANQAAVATTTALATTWTGLGIANPTGSAKNIIIHEFSVAWTLTGSTAGAVGLIASTDSGFASALTAISAMNGQGTSIAECDDGATIATPILIRVLSSYGTGATNLYTSAGPVTYDIGGSIILPPGRSVLTSTTLATTAAAVFCFLWEEVDA